MPDTMIERIGQAIFRAEHSGAVEPVALTEREVTMARAVLAAMREPTDAMEEAGCAAVRDDGVPGWYEMIDAALAEGR